MDTLKMLSDKSFDKSKMRSCVFSKTLHSEVTLKSLKYTALDRGLRELSESLFIFDPAIRFHRNKTMTKGGAIILIYPVLYQRMSDDDLRTLTFIR